MVWFVPNAKDIRDRLRRLSEIYPDLPEHVADFGTFFAQYLRNDSKLVPKTWVMAYRRAHFLWLLEGRPKLGGYFNDVTRAVHDPGFAKAAIREFETC